MKLSNRLLKITEFINKEDIVIDVGSDHGYLPCFLMLNNLCKKAYASDNKVGPINNAKENIEKFNVDVETILADGLKGCPKDVNTVVIAGMGDATAIEILEGYEDLYQFDNFVVQVNKNAKNIRKWVSDKMFSIHDEGIVFEDGHYYEIIAFNPKRTRLLSEVELQYGPINIERMEQPFVDYLSFLMNKYQKIVEAGGNKELLREIDTIKTILDNNSNF